MTSWAIDLGLWGGGAVGSRAGVFTVGFLPFRLSLMVQAFGSMQADWGGRVDEIGTLDEVVIFLARRWGFTGVG